MTRYSLAKLANRPKGAAVELPAIMETAGNTQSFLKAERDMLREMHRYVREVVLPGYEADRARARARLTIDMGEEDRTSFAFIAHRLAGIANGVVQRVLQLEAKRHTAQFKAAAKRTLGIDLSAVVRDEDVDDYLRMASARAAGLITGLADDTVKRISTAVTSAVINGTAANALRKTLVEEFRFSDRRAQLISRDQIAKVNSDLNKIRHIQAGVTEYRWLTSRDERVRERHRKLEGKVYEYGKLTGAENGVEPGQAVRCRCVARGIVRF